jgi:pimeloyl-ACP methyl ester carboxylesterase
MAGDRTSKVATPDGRTLSVVEAGVGGGPVVVAHHGTPSSGGFFGMELEGAARLGLRLVAYDRPGYGGSTPDPGRTVADAPADVAAILDELGIERFATYGVSGGGPHALACAALLPDRCVAAASVVGIGPPDAPDLDLLEGMGEGNVVEFAAARKGREALTEFLTAEAADMVSVQAEELRTAMEPHLSTVDAEALTGELAEYMLESVKIGLVPGVEGWVDDDLAFLEPWGFDLGMLDVPTLVWQGEQDLMVPAAHGHWLLEHVAGAEGEVFADEGHLTLGSHRIHEVLEWLAGHLR